MFTLESSYDMVCYNIYHVAGLVVNYGISNTYVIP